MVPAWEPDVSRIGIEFGARSIRAVKLGGWPRFRAETMEVSWDPERPAEALALLKERLGPARQVAAAVDLALLRVKCIELPPLPTDEKRRLLAMEPDRFFAVRGEDLVFAVSEGEDLVFAATEPLVAAWIEALQVVGPLERLEPAPAALARAFGKARIGEALVVVDGEAEGLELVGLRSGRVRHVRRLYGGWPGLAEAIAQAAEHEGGADGDGEPGTPIFLSPWDEGRARQITEVMEGVETRQPPDIDGLSSEFLVAYGAALDPGEGWREALVTPDLERLINRRRRSQLALSAGACFVALIFAVLSLDASRDRAGERLDSGIAGLRERASTALDLQTRAHALTSELAALDRIEAERPDPLHGLLELSRRLPEGAWVRSIRVGNGEWEINGYAPDAAALIPLFENDPRFEDVRFLSGTSRAQIDGETYENFALALRASRSP